MLTETVKIKTICNITMIKNTEISDAFHPAWALQNTTMYAKKKLNLSCYMPRRRLEGEEVKPQPYFNPRERTPGTHCTGGWWAPEPVWTQRLEEKSFHLCRG
jgi:hypothetical protein